jgi:HK97 family phage major capsid protein
VNYDHEAKMAASLRIARTERDTAETRAKVAELELRTTRQQVASLSVAEPSVYTADAPWSFIQDVCRNATRFGGADVRSYQAATERLRNHEREVELERPAREARATAARHATENALSATPQEARHLERFLRYGGRIFDYESRALTRTDSQGGYFTVPGWLTRDFVPAARAGMPFASLWRGLDLPRGVSTINIPQIVTGGAAPSNTDIAPGGGRDITDSFLSAKVMTCFGQIDMSLQWLELNPLPAADAIIMPDLADDTATQLDAQALLGTGGATGQLLGVLPGGSTTSGITTVNTNNANTSAQTYVNGGTIAGYSAAGSVRQTLSQLLGLIWRLRAAGPTHWIMAPQVWAWICGQTDTIGQPVIRDHGPHGDDTPPDGIAGWLMGVPVVVDPQLGPPTGTAGAGTFGGTGAPGAGATNTSNGQFAVVPGNGSYPAILCGRWTDCYLWSGEPQLRVLTEAMAGTKMARVQLWSYHASAPARYQAPGAYSASNSNSTGGVTKGSAISYGTWVQYQANSPLAASNIGGY